MEVRMLSNLDFVISAYDNANRLTRISQGSANVSFGYDNDSRRTSLTLPNNVTLNYGYDALSQLTGVTYMLGTNTLGNLTFAYDLAGRRTGVGGSYARTGTPQAASAATYNANNQLTQWKGATLTYDANGNLTSDGTNSYTWNARNQLVTISGGAPASFQYDPFGRRVSKTIGGTTQYVYDGANPVQEISGTTASANLLTGGVDEYFQRTDSAGTRNFLTDALGSTLALTDSTGAVQTSYTFEPFGNTAVSGATTTNTFAYTGRELDATGLYFYRARYYSATLQRFISEDPIGYQGNTVNLYEHTYDNPTNLIDPSGEQVFIFLETPPVIDPALLEEGLRVSGGKNSLDLPDGGRLDMQGPPHTNPDLEEIPTPHVHDPLPPFEGSNWWRFPGAAKDWVRPATPDDFLKGIEYHYPNQPLPSDLFPGVNPGVAGSLQGRKPHTSLFRLPPGSA